MNKFTIIDKYTEKVYNSSTELNMTDGGEVR